MNYDAPLLGITADGRPMTRARVDEILAQCEDFRSVEPPALQAPDQGALCNPGDQVNP